MRIALAQLNQTVGDLDGNAAKIHHYWTRAMASGADLLVTPELSICGYLIEDLILNDSFVDHCHRAVMELAQKLDRGAVLVGAPWREGEHVYNAALLIGQGKIIAKTYKCELPNFSVFDEPRIFSAGKMPSPMIYMDVPIGVLVCEDLWHVPVARSLASKGAKLLICMNASPFDIEKDVHRKGHAKDRVTECGLPLLYNNLIGGQDEIVFDGASFVMNADAKIIGQCPVFAEHMAMVEFDAVSGAVRTDMPPAELPMDIERYIYFAAMTGLRDYVHKNGFRDVILGLSGGIDSALVAAIAVDALGANHVRALMLPSPFTSAESIEDAQNIAKNLGIRLDHMPITPMMQSVADTMVPIAPLTGLAHENMQSRLRGLCLMALSNQTGALLLSTGNKSEIATGYATLYGDMCGAYNPIKDFYKTQVIAVSEWRNSPDAGQHGLRPVPVMPQRVITKPPSAELRENQRDQDSLPPYPVLDSILYKFIELDQSVEHIIAHGYDRALVLQIAQMLDKAEYKRRQSAPGPKISTMQFGRDRRWPITNKWKRI